jgi:hypothetical protein
MLKDPFYYGEFEFPKNSGVWYRGAHESIISRETFLKVREKMKVPPKSK